MDPTYIADRVELFEVDFAGDGNEDDIIRFWYVVFKKVDKFGRPRGDAMESPPYSNREAAEAFMNGWNMHRKSFGGLFLNISHNH